MTITKNKAIYRITAIAMALCMLMALSVSAFAAEVNANGGSAQTPVNLTTSNDGIGGEASDTATKLSVTVPTALPMAMSDDGNVVTATDCKIVNNSYGAVRVKSVTISAAENWNLTAFGDKKTLASEKVDSNKLGFAITIGGGQQMQTSTNEKTQKLIAAPIEGCYMTGVGDTTSNSVSVGYKAIVTPLSGTVDNATVASVVFVIEWDTAA